MTGIGWWGVPLAVLAGAIRLSTPFLFVSLGECITEKSGRINLGLEGILVMGAMAGYGYGGILIAFIARHHPLAIVPVAVLVGGISASGGMLQRRLDLPDATVLVLQGVAFMAILASEALYGRVKIFRPAA